MNNKCFFLLLAMFSAPLLGQNVVSRPKRSDDVPALQAVVEQLATVLQALQAKFTALESETAALKSKQQLLSSTVAFSVRFSTDDVARGLPLSSKATLMFDYTIYNAGNGYDVTTGLFTAPVSGTYSFFLTTMSVNQRTSVYLSIVKQGTILDDVYAEGGSDAYDQGSTQVVTHLAVGEKVWVRQDGSTDAVRGGTWTVFTGYMLQPQ